MTFNDLGIIEPILEALQAEGYTHPTPIQAQSIPVLLEGKDLLGCAQTGTGKTAAFAIPILQNIYLDETKEKGKRKIKALIVTPTRELAVQIGESFSSYGKHTGIKNAVIFGGVKQGAQVDAVRRGVDVLVATPGRLLDLMNQGYISLRDIEYFGLDEADQMLDMGFIHDIRRIITKLPKQRQSLFFSATMPLSILDLSGKILGDPIRVAVKPEQATAERVEQAVYFVAKSGKSKLLIHLLKENSYTSTLIFSRTKSGADRIARVLNRADIQAEAIHGNKSQNARQRALNNFKAGETKVLVATDIAARGIDVDELALVINYDLPNIPETYVHRIGRTGRASASGVAHSFCAVDEKPYLRDIQKLIKQQIPVISDHPFPDDGTEVPEPKQQRGRRPQNGNSSRRTPNNRSGNNSRGEEGNRSGGRSRKPRGGSSEGRNSGGNNRPRRSESRNRR